MTHIAYYLLQKLPELKKRAYLARFLIKIEVSPDIEGDQDVSQLINQVMNSNATIFIISSISTFCFTE